ncbi:MAG: restriction endonuclease subunit S [Kiritimatiellales bacterium]
MHKNETRPGYKKTKVGWIPEGWEETYLGKICDLQSGKFIAASAILEGKEKNSFPCFGGNGLRGYVDSYSHDGNYPLIGRQGALCGNVCWASGKFYATEHAVVATPTEKTASKWLYYKLDHLNLNKYATGVAQPGLSVQVLNQVASPLPPLPEQEAIAEVLECRDRGIRNLECKIVKKQLIKKGLMQKLLSGKIRLPGFSKDWKTVKVKSFASLTAGGTPSTNQPEYWGGKIPWMSSGDLNLRRVFDVQGRITEKGLQNSSTKYIPKHSVLIGLAGQGKTRGTVAINEIELCTNQSVAAIMPDAKKVFYHFLYANLDSRYNELRRMSAGDGGRGGLNLSLLGKLTISLPSLEEQRAIAEVLSAADREIEALEKKLALWKEQKKYLLNNLVTGTLRLPAFAGK